jgi:hypothetical protein
MARTASVAGYLGWGETWARLKVGISLLSTPSEVSAREQRVAFKAACNHQSARVGWNRRSG